MFVVGISPGDPCDVEWDTRREAKVGVPHVRCGWQRCHRYPGDDQNSAGLFVLNIT